MRLVCSLTHCVIGLDVGQLCRSSSRKRNGRPANRATNKKQETVAPEAPGACADPFRESGIRHPVSTDGVAAEYRPAGSSTVCAGRCVVGRDACALRISGGGARLCARGGAFTTRAHREHRGETGIRERGTGIGGGEDFLEIGAQGKVRVLWLCARGGEKAQNTNGEWSDLAPKGPRVVATGGAERNPWGVGVSRFFTPRRGGGVSR